MNIEKIKKILKEFQKNDYRDYFAAVLLNEKINYMHEIEDITENDIKYIDEIYDDYTSNDNMSLLSEEISGKIWEIE